MNRINADSKEKAIAAAMKAIEQANKFDLNEKEKSEIIDHVFYSQLRDTSMDGTTGVVYPSPTKVVQ